MRVSVQVLTSCCCVKKSGDDSTQGMGQWWDHYQSLSSDEKETAISQYNRQRAKTRRKQNIEANESKDTTAEIEPLVNVPEARSRRARREQPHSKDHVARSPESSTANLNTDHPIMKRKRVQRDLSQVVFGPTQ